jgi:hypothetical protein
MPSSRAPAVAAVLAAAVMSICGGCSTAAERAEPPLAASGAAPCAETVATPPAARPAALAATTSDWFGQGDLWVGLPDHPPTAQGDALVLKFPVVTLVKGVSTAAHGPPVVTAERTGAPAETPDEAPGQVGGFAQAFGTGDLSFWPASVAFPSPGCWTVTGLLAAESVQFTVSVEAP